MRAVRLGARHVLWRDGWGGRSIWLQLSTAYAWLKGPDGAVPSPAWIRDGGAAPFFWGARAD